MNNKTSQGRKKIKIKKIEKYSSRQVTFSKRRNGLFKKGVEFCVLTGAKISIIVNSPSGRVFAFGHPNVDALINTYLANEENVDVDLDMGQSALPRNEFNNHYEKVSRELELEMKRKDMIPENSGREFWFDEPIDGMDVAKLEQYIYSLQELKRKGPTVLQHLQGPKTNVLQGPNVLCVQGLNVFDDAWKNNNGQNYFDHALMINANVQGQGSVN
nr:agamous-like MADS-box protein AGL62 [Tanacetum cinerariifolium]GEY10961.1 agamous-like MADS-box protein AGL62 [Tanacetum cinerariifolium]